MAWRGGRTACSGVWGRVVFRATHPAIDLLVPLAVSPGSPINPRRRTVPLPPFCAAICRPFSGFAGSKKLFLLSLARTGASSYEWLGGLRAEFRPRALLTAGRCWQQRAQRAQPLSVVHSVLSERARDCADCRVHPRLRTRRMPATAVRAHPRRQS